MAAQDPEGTATSQTTVSSGRNRTCQLFLRCGWTQPHASVLYVQMPLCSHGRPEEHRVLTFANLPITGMVDRSLSKGIAFKLMRENWGLY